MTGPEGPGGPAARGRPGIADCDQERHRNGDPGTGDPDEDWTHG